MPKGIPVDPELRARATRAAIEAARDGVPAHVVAAWYQVSGRALYRWLQSHPDAYAARLAAISSGRRFTHAGVLAPSQERARRQMALRRLAAWREQHGIELRKPRPRTVRIPPAPKPVIEHRTF